MTIAVPSSLQTSILANGTSSSVIRNVFIADDDAYKLELTIANLTDGSQIAYAKRNLDFANDLLKKQAETAGTHHVNRLDKDSYVRLC